MGVAEAQQRISSHEFAEWRAYDLRHPIGPERSETMAAVVASTVANFSGRVKRSLKHTDFLPTYGPPKRQAPQDMMNRIMMAGKLSAAAKKQREEKARKALERKQTKDTRKKPTDHGQRGNRQRKVHRSDRSI